MALDTMQHTYQLPDAEKALEELCETIVKKLGELREKDVTILKYDGKDVTTETPGWLNVAFILRDFLCSSHCWLHCKSLLKFIEQSIKDLDIAIDALSEEDPTRENFAVLRDGLSDYLVQSATIRNM